MKLLADEGVDRPIIERLRDDGYDVIAIAELAPSVPDDDVLRRASDQGRLLLTADKDFGEMVYRRGLAHSGAVLIRLAGLSNRSKAAIVSDALTGPGAGNDRVLLRDRARLDPHPEVALTTPSHIRMRIPCRSRCRTNR